MSKYLQDWQPSNSALELIKLNGISDDQIKNALDYLKKQPGLNSIDNIEGYEDWNTFFIMFCIKANEDTSRSKVNEFLNKL